MVRKDQLCHKQPPSEIPPYTQHKQWIPHGASHIPEILPCYLHVHVCVYVVPARLSEVRTQQTPFEIGRSSPFSFQTMELKPMTVHAFVQVIVGECRPSCTSVLKSGLLTPSPAVLTERPELDELTLERVLEELETLCHQNMVRAIETQEGLGIEYDEDVVCDVCRSPEGEDGNEMVFCDKCNVCVHQVGGPL